MADHAIITILRDNSNLINVFLECVFVVELNYYKIKGNNKNIVV